MPRRSHIFLPESCLGCRRGEARLPGGPASWSYGGTLDDKRGCGCQGRKRPDARLRAGIRRPHVDRRCADGLSEPQILGPIAYHERGGKIEVEGVSCCMCHSRPWLTIVAAPRVGLHDALWVVRAVDEKVNVRTECS